ncbi:MAG: zinc ABC transporter substrate-binding protein [Deltaproteobacteria bacterium]|nr:zinc ABC transporter substrate-binding protein [Deltaproteobacteria bacterium]
MRASRIATLQLFGMLGLLGSLLSVSLPARAVASGAELVVYTVSYPLAYFAERIGGDAVAVRFPAPAEIDPAFWKPGAEIISDYQAADLILLNGAGYASWTRHASLPRRNLLDTSRSFRDAYLDLEAAPVHQHGPAGEHTHGEVAFTTWLDPRQAIVQARAIEDALARRIPAATEALASRTDALVADLEALDRELEAAFAAYEGEPLLASHPVYAYLARRYQLDLRSFTWEPDRDPGEKGWRELDRALAERPARWMLWEAQPIESTRSTLEARGVKSIVFEVAANRPSSGDFLSVMRANLAALGGAAGGGGR